jgi:hypothetical protein
VKRRDGLIVACTPKLSRARQIRTDDVGPGCGGVGRSRHFPDSGSCEFQINYRCAWHLDDLKYVIELMEYEVNCTSRLSHVQMQQS